MNYTVLSPWAEVSSTQVCALNPRLDTLNGRTIGMFSHFKGHSPYILREVEKEILKKYPEARFSYLQYPKDTREIKDDAEFQPVFKAWLDGVDGVIAAYGDAGEVSGYALPAMRWACDAGIVTGVTESALEPRGTATRAQAATMFMRFLNLVSGGEEA